MIEAWLVPTWHPAAVLRDMRKQHAVVEDLKKGVRIFRDGGPTLIPRCMRNGGEMPQWMTHPTLADWKAWHRDHHRMRLASDFEATLRRQMWCNSFWPVDTWLEDDGICFPFRVRGGAKYWSPSDYAEGIELLREVYEDPEWLISGQNFVGYDYQHVAKLGFTLRGFDQDTLVSSHFVYAELPQSLAFQSSMRTDLPAYKLAVKEADKAEDDDDEDDSVKGIENVAEIDDRKLRIYCNLDAFATAGAALHNERMMA